MVFVDSLMTTKFSLFSTHTYLYSFFISGKIRSVVPVSSLHLALQDFLKCCFLHIFVLMVATKQPVINVPVCTVATLYVSTGDYA